MQQAIRRTMLGLSALLLVFSILATTSQHASAYASNCRGGRGIFWNWPGHNQAVPSNCGYFNPDRAMYPPPRGQNLWPEAWWGINSVNDLIGQVTWQLYNGDPHHKTVAAYYVLSMTTNQAGQSKGNAYDTRPWAAGGRGITAWQEQMRSLSNISDGPGGKSIGSSGYIVWDEVVSTPCGWGDTFYAQDIDDVAPTTDVSAPSLGIFCGPGQYWHSATFYRGGYMGNGGAMWYMVDRHCGNNRIGTSAGPAPSNPDFSIHPSIGVTVPGGGSIAQVGDTVQFNYSVHNDGPYPASGLGCAVYDNVYSGYHAQRNGWDSNSGAPPGGSPGPGVNCPSDIGPGGTANTTESVTLTASNQTVCRTLFVNPATWSRNPQWRAFEACVIIANKPYAKVFSGDIAAGAGLETAPSTCTNNTDAQIAGWNRGSAASYAGAGTQYAAYALGAITDFASAQRDIGSSVYTAKFWNYSGSPSMSGAPVYQTTTPTVNYDWGGGGPGNGIGNDYFSAQFTRDVDFAAGTYNFTATTDDGFRVYIDGNPIFDQWNVHAPTSYSTVQTLSAGVHHIQIDYFEYGGVAVMQFGYSLTSGMNSTAALPPLGLTFANTSVSSPYGGQLGSMSSFCIPDYFARKPSTTNAWSNNVSSMHGTGAYFSGGNAISNGGNVNPGDRIAAYVDGDLWIKNDIKYTGSWSSLDQIPQFQVIVRGNIYIDKSVKRLDGVYIAQRKADGSKGIIYTCAIQDTATTAKAPVLDGSFYSTCKDNKLTVNGALMANSIELLRTYGDAVGANPGDTTDENGGPSNAAEVLNFNPTVWLAAPVNGSGRADSYDAITSLPPVL